MDNLILVSETDLDQALEKAISEILSSGYSLSKVNSYDALIKAINPQKNSLIIINAQYNKIKAYELCRELCGKFRDKLRIIVYLPEASPKDGSSFGKLGVDLEDSISILRLMESLNKEHLTLKNFSKLTLIANFNGACGASSLAILLAHYLSHNQKIILAESNNNFGLSSLLQINNIKSIFKKDFTTIKDQDWFAAFLTRILFAPKLYYLNLFANLQDKLSFDQEYYSFIENFTQEIGSKITNLDRITQTLEFFVQELSGKACLDLYEILSLASNNFENILWDISHDFNSIFNRQLLNLSPKIIILFRDDLRSKTHLIQFISLLKEKYQLEVFPILAPNHYSYNIYNKFTANQWEDLFGFIPKIFPYDPIKISSFFKDSKEISDSHTITKFIQELAQSTSLSKVNSKIRKDGVFRFLKKSEEELCLI